MPLANPIQNREGIMPIEQLAPEFARLIGADAEIARHTPDDYGGDNGPAEGPVWWSDGGYLLFSDIHNNRRIKFVPGQGASVDHEPTNRSNGLTRDLQGRLIACEHDSRRVTRTEPDGSITVVAASFQGRRLNRPNDVVVKSDGCIYFTDPWTLPTPPEQWDLPYSGVYRVTPRPGQHHAAGGRLRGAQRPGLLARREHSLHQRLAAGPHPLLRCQPQRLPG